MAKLSDKIVADATCPEGKKDALLFDDALPGFGVRITAGGKRVFLLQYRNGAKVRRVVLGTFGTELTTSQARKKAETLRGQVRDQRDPVAERKAAQAAALEAEAQSKAAAAARAYTIERLIEQWTTHHLAERSASYRAATPKTLRSVLAKWLDAPASSLAQTDAVHLLDEVKAERGPIAANRVRALARSCWGWAVKRGALAVNPWMATPQPARETARERVLSDLELAALWRAAEALDHPWAPIVQILILTGQRRGEVAGMAWAELELDGALWSMPGERTKNGQPHTVPLAPAVLALIRKAPQRKGAALVFEGPRKTAPSGFGKVKERLDDAMRAEAKKARRPFHPWVIHDIRRTVATGLQRLGVRLEVTEAVLNHISGSRSGIVGVYQRHGWEREKAEALKAWEGHVLGLVEGRGFSAKVVPIRVQG
ncbi:site-specific integrase [Roseomonas sp. SSH11]|uniref:Site-specific integrase n=1 Tax=Pararoseomonas baculiformis TaxID=2820812 RepID=A0ABS4AJR8_9PROT|nr:site-specific integrase [Pararoseomonas baculiformis]